MNSQVEVQVGGLRLKSFQRGALQFSLNEMTASFDIEYALPDRTTSERPLFPGDRVAVYIDGELVIDGYVDTTDDDDGPDSLALRAAGRSRSADLVDCSAEKHGFSGQTALAIARAIASPFDVPVEISDGALPGPVFPNFSVQRGETAGDAIRRATQLRGLYPFARGRGLELARVFAEGPVDTVLERGKEPLRRTGRSDSWYARYSAYVFRGQVPSTDQAWGAKASQLKHAVTDPEITRYRPLLVQVEAHGIGDLRTRATVVKNQRAGEGERVVCQCTGLVTTEGKPWRPNMRVRLINPVLDINDALVVSTVRMRFGEQQPTETDLELARPESFDIGDYKALHKRKKWYQT
jgi:prophage tail gpP-like protein